MSASGKLRGITDDMIREMWGRSDIPLHRFASALGVVPTAISYHAKRLGLERPRPKPRKTRDEVFTRMWLAGVPRSEIAQYFGYSAPRCVARERERLGLPPRLRFDLRSRIRMREFWEQELGERMRAA